MSGGMIGPEYDSQIRQTIVAVRSMGRTSSEMDLTAQQKAASRFPTTRAVLVQTMTAPSSSSAVPTSVMVATLTLDLSTKQLTPTSMRIRAYNYTAGNSAAKGTYCVMQFIGVWEIVWLACDPTAAWESLLLVPT
jgi:hypothetical protein